MPNPSLCTASHGVHIVHLHMMLGVLIYGYAMFFEQLNISVPHVKCAAECKGESRCAVQGTCLFPEEVCKIQDPLVYRILLLWLLLWLLLHSRHRHTFHCLSRSLESTMDHLCSPTSKTACNIAAMCKTLIVNSGRAGLALCC